MSIHQILSTGRSSLLAHQAAITVASTNTASADVEGYTKRDVHFANLPGHSGVGIDSIRRRADEWIDRRLYLERSRLGAQSSQSQGLAALDLQLGDIDRGIGTTFDRFFASLRALQTAPADRQLRSDLLAEAQSLVENFNVAASTVDREQQQADVRLQSVVTETNEILKEIAQLNASVRQSLVDGGEPSADLDRRDVLLSQLAEQVEITALDAHDGSITVLLGGGRALVQGGEAMELQTEPDPARNGLSQVYVVDGSGLRSDLTDEIGLGKIGGLIELRDGIIADTGERIDALAFDFAAAFNALHETGFGTDGGTGRSFFTPMATATDAASAISLAPGLIDNPEWFAASTTAAGSAGGNDNALAMGALAEQNAASGNQRTFGQEYASIVAEIGSAASRQRTRETQAQVQVDQLHALKESQTGVSIDEELIDITRFERAFQSASRIIRTVEEMFDTLLQL